VSRAARFYPKRTIGSLWEWAHRYRTFARQLEEAVLQVVFECPGDDVHHRAAGNSMQLVIRHRSHAGHIDACLSLVSHGGPPGFGFSFIRKQTELRLRRIAALFRAEQSSWDWPDGACARGVIGE
jgi:hypothetical protein